MASTAADVERKKSDIDKTQKEATPKKGGGKASFPSPLSSFLLYPLSLFFSLSVDRKNASVMAETGGTKRKSRGGSPRDGDGNDFSEIQAFLDTVPLIDVAPKQQVIDTKKKKEKGGTSASIFAPPPHTHTHTHDDDAFLDIFYGLEQEK